MTALFWSVIAGSLAVSFGTAAGVLTGLTPGLHVNLVVFIVVSLSGALTLDPVLFSMFIVSMAVTHSYFDFIPAIFLGVPTGESAVAVFPGHRLLLRGKGPSAFAAAQAGGINASIITTILVCLLFAYPRVIHSFEAIIRPLLGYILAGFLVYFVVREIWKHPSASTIASVAYRAVAVLIALMMIAQLSAIALSGILVSSDLGIMAALTGLFGFSVLIISLLEQDGGTCSIRQDPGTVAWSNIARHGWSGLRGTLGGFIVGFLPGIGVGEVSALLARPSRETQGDDRDSADLSYIASVGAVGTADALVSIVALFLIGKSRSGASVGIEHLLRNDLAEGQPRAAVFIVLVFAGLAAGLVSLYLGQAVANRVGREFSKVRYPDLTSAILIALLVFSVVSGGIYTALLLAGSSFVGLFVLLHRIRPTTMMAFLIIPAASFFLGVEIPGFPMFRLPEVALWPRPEVAVLSVGLALGGVSGAMWYFARGWRR